mgnify:CR=1 FL=1
MQVKELFTNENLNSSYYEESSKTTKNPPKYLANYNRFDSVYKTQVSLSPKKEHYKTAADSSPERLRYEYKHNPDSLRFTKHGSLLMSKTPA